MGVTDYRVSGLFYGTLSNTGDVTLVLIKSEGRYFSVKRSA